MSYLPIRSLLPYPPLPWDFLSLRLCVPFQVLSPPAGLRGEVVEPHSRRRAIGHVHDGGSVDADGDDDRLADLFLGGALFQRLVDMALDTAVALRHERTGEGDELLGFGVERLLVGEVS